LVCEDVGHYVGAAVFQSSASRSMLSSNNTSDAINASSPFASRLL
jgi:hypothetical protein